VSPTEAVGDYRNAYDESPEGGTATVDNEDFAYYVVVTMRDDTKGTLVRFYGARVKYQQTEVRP